MRLQISPLRSKRRNEDWKKSIKYIRLQIRCELGRMGPTMELLSDKVCKRIRSRKTALTVNGLGPPSEGLGPPSEGLGSKKGLDPSEGSAPKKGLDSSEGLGPSKGLDMV